MSALIRRNFKLLKAKPIIILILLLYLPFIIGIQYLMFGEDFRFSNSFIMAMVVLTLALTQTTNQFDNTNKTQKTFLSLPISKAKYINAQYLWLFISLAISLVFCIVFYSISSILLSKGVFIPDLGNLLLAISVSIVVTGFVIPLSNIISPKIANGLMGGVLGASLAIISGFSEGLVSLSKNPSKYIFYSVYAIIIGMLFLVISYIVARILLSRKEIS